MRRVLHPYLAAAFPILFLFRINLWGMTAGDIAFPLAATLVSIAVVHMVAGRITHRPHKVGIVLSVIALLFLTYGHFWQLLGESGRTFGIDRDLVLGAVWAAIALVVITLTVRTKRTLVDLTSVLNVIAIGLVISVLVPIASELYKDRSASAATSGPQGIKLAASGAGVRRPDIYYFIFDRYAGQKTLQEVFDFDNSEFLDFLKANGFAVASRARANYQSTALSLATSLNMRYLDWATKRYEGRTSSREPIFDAVRNGQVIKLLKQLGYRYIHIGSRWDITRENPLADVNTRLDKTSEFTRVLYESTALLPFMRHSVAGPAPSELEEFSRYVALRQFEETARTRRYRSPKFVFAHVLLPHTPYVFDRNGRPVNKQPTTYPTRGRAYLDQLLYTNRRITQLVRTLLSGPADRRPVIILQADEGPYPDFSRHESAETWAKDDAALRVKYRILTAINLPGGKKSDIYPTMTPVNIFRVIFNTYFGAELALLPDDSYISFHDNIYGFQRITGRLREGGTAARPIRP